MHPQVDLAREARHLWQFNYNFRHSRYVTFPYPVYPLVSDEVLVETFEARNPCAQPLSCPLACRGQGWRLAASSTQAWRAAFSGRAR